MWRVDEGMKSEEDGIARGTCREVERFIRHAKREFYSDRAVHCQSIMAVTQSLKAFKFFLHSRLLPKTYGLSRFIQL
jgi:hypothetical protein